MCRRAAHNARAGRAYWERKEKRRRKIWKGRTDARLAASPAAGRPPMCARTAGAPSAPRARGAPARSAPAAAAGCSAPAERPAPRLFTTRPHAPYRAPPASRRARAPRAALASTESPCTPRACAGRKKAHKSPPANAGGRVMPAKFSVKFSVKKSDILPG